MTVCHDTVVHLTVKGSSGLGISLLHVVGEVYARVLNDGVKLMTADKVMDEQGGLRVGSGCNDQIFVVRQVVEKTIEKDRSVYIAFVDLEKAYDNVNRL